MRQNTRSDRNLIVLLSAMVGILLVHAIPDEFHTDFKQGFIEAIGG